MDADSMSRCHKSLHALLHLWLRMHILQCGEHVHTLHNHNHGSPLKINACFFQGKGLALRPMHIHMIKYRYHAAYLCIPGHCLMLTPACVSAGCKLQWIRCCTSHRRQMPGRAWAMASTCQGRCRLARMWAGRLRYNRPQSPCL